MKTIKARTCNAEDIFVALTKAEPGDRIEIPSGLAEVQVLDKTYGLCSEGFTLHWEKKHEPSKAS